MLNLDLVNLATIIIGVYYVVSGNKIKNIIFISLYIVLIALLSYFNHALILMIDIMMIFLIFIKKFIKGKYNGIKNEYYNALTSNYNNQLLLTNYKKRLHEDKNHILIIRGMTNEKEDTLNEYIDSLIDDKDYLDNNYVAELCNITNIGIKNFLNSKISKILKLNASLELYVSEEIKNISYVNDINELNNLYTILGVLFDNIIDSISLCDTKLVSVMIYISKRNLYFELANSYKEKVDIEKLGNGHYSTKDNNHGVGLSLVNNIIAKSDIFNLESFIVDNFFVQKLEIKIKE